MCLCCCCGFQARDELKLAGEIKTCNLNENLTPDLKRSLETLGTNEAKEITKHGGGGMCIGLGCAVVSKPWLCDACGCRRQESKGNGAGCASRRAGQARL